MKTIGPTGHAIRTVLTIAVGMTVVSTVLAVAALGTTFLLDEFGPSAGTANTLEWAGRTPTYSSTECVDCHAVEVAITARAEHATVSCQGCHVPSRTHAEIASEALLSPPITIDGTCTSCHAEAAGRPEGFPTISPALHYGTATCVACHDPHAATALSPPVVTHPLAKLPPCTTCHTPEGLKGFPEGHAEAPDAVCRVCHVPERRDP